jgi:hypothetical protein
MKRLTKDESIEWLAKKQFGIEPGGHHFLRTNSTAYGVDLSLPESSRGRAIVARAVAESFEESRETMLFITEWGVWPSEESWPLMERALAGYGDPRPVAAAPGFLFGFNEIDDLAAFVRYALISGWSAGVVAPKSPIGFSLTDDDWIGIFGTSEEAVRDFVGRPFIDNFGMRVLWEGTL